MKLLLMALVGFSALTVAEGEVGTEGREASIIIEPSSSVVTIESASLGFDETATSVLKITARASEMVDSFTVRVRVYGSATDKKPQGVVSRVVGPLGSDTRSFEVRLSEWFIETQHLKVSVGSVQVGPSPSEGVCYGFCAAERTSCRMDCGASCIARFTCKVSTTSCESDCYCKSTPACGG